MNWQQFNNRKPILCVTLGLLLACKGPSGDDVPKIYAASSTRDALFELQQACPVQFQSTFAGSQTLALQIHHGAPADVFVSASPHQSKWLEARGHLEASKTLAYNQLHVAFSATQPEAKSPLQVLNEANRIVLGVRGSPIGNYSHYWLEEQISRGHTDSVLHIRAKVVSFENNTRMVIQRILRHEADAAIVYATDVRAFPNLKSIAIPHTEVPDIRLTFAWLTRSGIPENIRNRITDCLVGSQATRILKLHGFEVRQ